MSVNRPTGHAEGKGEPLVAIALASGSTYAEAAAAGGVHLATVKKRLADNAYRTRVARLRGELLEQALGVLSHNCAGAAQCLSDLMHSESDLVAQKAARSVIEMALRVRREAEFEARVLALENALERNQREANRRG
jgi:hypothetical protein